ncbi:hypothetical protein Q4493_15390 [Colwellia sp. 1_MG-2023]|uniref:hypothetical protein n=1 Tax=Colwellia sp. 1_MG-2023 TaxID=3062649 RepID=UPI0026E3629C|nr:hypothetical protein [Colwellia sp. 1_MG-2023]MDO6447154.1 hypothetical protein [Colwellia sp. 1_MG-2023]
MSKYTSEQKKRAKKLITQIKKSSTTMQTHMYEFIQSESFKVLGFETFKSWAKENEQEVGISYDSMLSYHHTARVTHYLFGEEHIGTIPPFVLKPLFPLTEEQLDLISEKTLEEFKTEDPSEMKLTNKKVKSIVERLGLVTNQNHDTGSSKKSKTQNKLILSLNNHKSNSVVKSLRLAIDETFTSKQQIRLCRDVLKEFEGSNVDKAIKYIESVLEEL